MGHLVSSAWAWDRLSQGAGFNWEGDKVCVLDSLSGSQKNTASLGQLLLYLYTTERLAHVPNRLAVLCASRVRRILRCSSDSSPGLDRPEHRRCCRFVLTRRTVVASCNHSAATGNPIGNVKSWFGNQVLALAQASGRSLGATDVTEQEGILLRVCCTY